MKKVSLLFFNLLPILIMIGLIPFVSNDYILTLIYIVIIGISFKLNYAKNEIIIFVFGFVIMILCEYLFVSTGVETFVRHSLFGLMPLWLPCIWGYGFVAIKRGADIIG